MNCPDCGHGIEFHYRGDCYYGGEGCACKRSVDAILLLDEISVLKAELAQYQRLASEGEGRATFAVLEELFGWGRREAEKRRAAWAEAGIVAPDPNEKNAWKLTEAFMAA